MVSLQGLQVWSKADWNNAMRNAEAEYKAKYEADTTEPATEQKVAV